MAQKLSGAHIHLSRGGGGPLGVGICGWVWCFTTAVMLAIARVVEWISHGEWAFVVRRARVARCREGCGCVDRCVGALDVLCWSWFVGRVVGAFRRPSGTCVGSLTLCREWYLVGV